MQCRATDVDQRDQNTAVPIQLIYLSREGALYPVQSWNNCWPAGRGCRLGVPTSTIAFTRHHLVHVVVYTHTHINIVFKIVLCRSVGLIQSEIG